MENGFKRFLLLLSRIYLSPESYRKWPWYPGEMGELVSLIQDGSLEGYITEHIIHCGEEPVQKIQLLKDKNLLKVLARL